MFIKLSTSQGNQPLGVNTNQICTFEGNHITMSNGDEYTLVGNSRQELENILYPQEQNLPDVVEHKQSEAGDFLTKLHKLLGGRGEAKLTTDRKARLMTRMKDFTKEELVLAATNLGQDEFMQGGNDSGKRYGTIDYLLRTSANVNKWLEEAPKKPKSMFG